MSPPKAVLNFARCESSDGATQGGVRLAPGAAAVEAAATMTAVGEAARRPSDPIKAQAAAELQVTNQTQFNLE